MSGSSVVPGFPKRYSTPWATRVSITISRPVHVRDDIPAPPPVLRAPVPDYSFGTSRNAGAGSALEPGEPRAREAASRAKTRPGHPGVPWSRRRKSSPHPRRARHAARSRAGAVGERPGRPGPGGAPRPGGGLLHPSLRGLASRRAAARGRPRDPRREPRGRALLPFPASPRGVPRAPGVGGPRVRRTARRPVPDGTLRHRPDDAPRPGGAPRAVRRVHRPPDSGRGRPPAPSRRVARHRDLGTRRGRPRAAALVDCGERRRPADRVRPGRARSGRAVRLGGHRRRERRRGTRRAGEGREGGGGLPRRPRSRSGGRPLFHPSPGRRRRGPGAPPPGRGRGPARLSRLDRGLRSGPHHRLERRRLRPALPGGALPPPRHRVRPRPGRRAGARPRWRGGDRAGPGEGGAGRHRGAPRRLLGVRDESLGRSRARSSDATSSSRQMGTQLGTASTRSASCTRPTASLSPPTTSRTAGSSARSSTARGWSTSWSSGAGSPGSPSAGPAAR